MDDDTRESRFYTVLVTMLYVVAVGVQVYVVADEMSHGRLTEQLATKWRTVQGRLTARLRLDRAVREATPYVLWEAHQALEEQTP